MAPPSPPTIAAKKSSNPANRSFVRASSVAVDVASATGIRSVRVSSRISRPPSFTSTACVEHARFVAREPLTAQAIVNVVSQCHRRGCRAYLSRWCRCSVRRPRAQRRDHARDRRLRTWRARCAPCRAAGHPCRRRWPAARTVSSSGVPRQVVQHVLQNAAALEVLDFVVGVEPARHRHVLLLAVGAADRQHQILARLDLLHACRQRDVDDLVAFEAEALARRRRI